MLLVVCNKKPTTIEEFDNTRTHRGGEREGDREEREGACVLSMGEEEVRIEEGMSWLPSQVLHEANICEDDDSIPVLSLSPPSPPPTFPLGFLVLSHTL